MPSQGHHRHRLPAASRCSSTFSRHRLLVWQWEQPQRESVALTTRLKVAEAPVQATEARPGPPPPPPAATQQVQLGFRRHRLI